MGPGRRPFSALEAWIYERFIAAAARDVVVPVIAPLLRGRTVLDVGCGGGLVAAALDGVVVTGVDPALSQARRAGGIAASAEHLPLASGTFDTVISACAIKHWPDPVAGVAECDRVLVDDGVLVVVEIDHDASLDEMRAFAAMTSLPSAVHGLYARFDLRAVLPTAPTAAELSEWVGAPATKIAGQPYLVATRARRT